MVFVLEIQSVIRVINNINIINERLQTCITRIRNSVQTEKLIKSLIYYMHTIHKLMNNDNIYFIKQQCNDCCPDKNHSITNFPI